MSRLFVAIAIPASLAQALVRLQPSALRSLRRVAPDQMHLTLHFIGEAEIAAVAALLQRVKFQPFVLTLNGLGHFSQGAVLWAGVQPHAALTALHGQIGTALQGGGIAVDSRTYRPHITLARSKPPLAREVLRDFLQQALLSVLEPNQPTDGAALQIPVHECLLYSSTLTPSGPLYRIERRFPANG